MLDSLLPLTSYLCLTKFAYAKRYPLGQRGEPPQRTDKPHNDNFALPLTLCEAVSFRAYLLPLTSYLTKGEGLLPAENDLDAPVAVGEFHWDMLAR